MPGFMGLRGITTADRHDTARREKREEARREALREQEQERRANEKVQEILQHQEEARVDSEGSSDTQIRIQDSDGSICQLSVADVMSRRVAVISYDDTLLTVQGIFASVRFHHLPVVDEAGNLIGLMSDRDLYKVVSPFLGTVNEQNRDREVMNRKVGTIMTRSLICAYPDMLITDAVRLMSSHLISCLPVLKRNSNLLDGIVTWKDVVRAFCPESFGKESASTSLRQGVVVNPESTESARLRVKSASDSVRVRTRIDAGRSDSARMLAVPQPPPPSDRPTPSNGHATDAFPKVGNIEVPLMDGI